MTISKVIHPLTHANLNGRKDVPVFCKIEFDGRRLLITGVEGPKRNGDAVGSCGQIVDRLAGAIEWTLAPGWTETMLARFIAVWKNWHLNDMRPECEHQRALGWRTIADREATLCHWRLNSETQAKQRMIRDLYERAMRTKGQASIDPSEQALLNFEYNVITYTADSPAPEYEPAIDKSHDATEAKVLGELKPEEHPDGILYRPCPVCGYRYGSQWLCEDVPDDVIEFLASLPETDVTPAWV